MLADAFTDIIVMFSSVAKLIAGLVLIFGSLSVSIIAFQKYKIALFLENPTESDRFNAWYEKKGLSYASIEYNAEEYLKDVKLAREYERLYARRDKAKQLFNERQDAYRFIQALDKQTYTPQNRHLENKTNKITYDNGFDDAYYQNYDDYMFGAYDE